MNIYLLEKKSIEYTLNLLMVSKNLYKNTAVVFNLEPTVNKTY